MNRCACVVVMLAALLVGCAPRVPVDHDGDPATPAISMDEAGVERWAAREAKRADDRDKAAMAEAERAVRRASRDAQAGAEDKIADIEADLGARLSASAERRELVADAAADAMARIAEQRDALDAVGGMLGSPAVSGAVGAIPGVGPIAALALAGVTGWIGRRSGVAKVGEVEARAAATERAAGRVVDSIDALKLASPEVRAALKAHAAEVAQWQGPEGQSLVRRLQAGVP